MGIILLVQMINQLWASTHLKDMGNLKAVIQYFYQAMQKLQLQIGIQNCKT